MFKVSSHCSFRLDLHELWSKERGENQIGTFDSRPQTPWKQMSNEILLGHATHCWKDIFEGYKILPLRS